MFIAKALLQANLDLGARVVISFMRASLAALSVLEGPLYKLPAVGPLFNTCYEKLVDMEMMLIGFQARSAGQEYAAGKLYPSSTWIYDAVVYDINSIFGWGPRRHLIEAHYRHYTSTSARHVEVGLASPLFLLATVPPSTAVMLLDVDDGWLDKGDKVLRAKGFSSIETRHQDITKPSAAGAETFAADTIGLNYVLHCVPGSLAAESKGASLRHLKSYLAPGGVIFGSTILGDDAPHTGFGRTIMRRFNGNGIFSNRLDTEKDMRAALGAAFARSEVRTVGCVCFFAATDDPSRALPIGC